MAKINIPESLSTTTIFELKYRACELNALARSLRAQQIPDLADEAEALCQKLRSRAKTLSAYLKKYGMN